MIDHNIEDCILKALLKDETYVRKVLPHIKPDFFSGRERIIYETILGYIQKYNKLPNSTVLAVEFAGSDAAGTGLAGDVLAKIESLADAPDHNEKWLVDKTEAWCKDRALMLAITEAVSIIDGKRPDKSTGIIPDILQSALNISFDTAVGHDYFLEAEARFDAYSKQESRIPFDIDMLNIITNGGVGPGTLNVILAGTNVGKSLAMCHLSSAYLAQGKNVLYITMEMSEERISERIDANLLDVDLKKLPEMEKSNFLDKINRLKKRTSGRLIVKQYPTGSAHVGHFRALLQELKMKKDFIPDIICVDYINICCSSKIKAIGGSVNSYTYIKSIAEELRGLAVEAACPLWTATQTTRSGSTDTDVGLTDTSESFGLPMSADFMIALINTEELEAAGQYLVKQLKNRYNESLTNRRFTIGVERGKMRLFDVEDPLLNVMNESTANKDGPVVDTPFSRSREKPKDFAGFKT